MRILDEPTVQSVGPAHAAPAATRTAQPTATRRLSPSTLEFLAWLSRQPRTYAETMEAWQTSCPRNSVWEDALGDDLIRLESHGSCIDETAVVLTALGRALLVGA